MKKTIICLAMAIMSFTNVALAANKNVQPAKVVNTYANGTPLCLAICKGDLEIVKKFIEYGANINETSNGMTPLMYAARYNNVEILKLLVEKGADFRLKDEKGITALQYAERSNANDAVTFLKEAAKK